MSGNEDRRNSASIPLEGLSWELSSDLSWPGWAEAKGSSSATWWVILVKLNASF